MERDIYTVVRQREISRTSNTQSNSRWMSGWLSLYTYIEGRDLRVHVSIDKLPNTWREYRLAGLGAMRGFRAPRPETCQWWIFFNLCGPTRTGDSSGLYRLNLRIWIFQQQVYYYVERGIFLFYRRLCLMSTRGMCVVCYAHCKKNISF